MTTTTTRNGTWRELAAAGGLGRFLLVCLGVYLHAADSLVMATLVPAVVGDIGGIAYVGWTISLYQIGAVVAGSAAAMLCQRTGVRPVLAAAALSYGLGCVLAAAAPTMPILLCGRLVQGMGGGILIALSSIVVQQSFPEHLWGRLFGIVAVIWSAGSLLGPLIGGLFADFGVWRWAFWSFALQAFLLAAVAQAVMPGGTPAAALTGRWSFLPLLVLSAATLAIAEAGVTGRVDLAALECALGLGLLWLAARLDRRSLRRLLPEATLDLRHKVGLGLLLVLALSVGSTAFWAYGPLILKARFGTDPLISGYILAGEAIAWTVGTMAVSGLAPSAAGAIIRVGAALVFVGGAGLALAVPSGSLVGIVLCILLHGAGFGACWPAIIQRTVRHSPEREATLAAAAPGTIQRIGYSVGAAATGIAANASGLADGMSSAGAASFWFFAAFIPVLGVGLVSAWLFARE